MAAQSQTQLHPRGGQLHALSATLESLFRQTQLTTKNLQSHARLTHLPADVDIVTWLCRLPQQRLPGSDLAKHGDTNIQWALGGVAANQLAAVFFGQSV